MLCYYDQHYDDPPVLLFSFIIKTHLMISTVNITVTNMYRNRNIYI